jgi:uncharacterized membrane protein YfcA
MPDLPWQLFAAAFVIGVSKTGFSGISLVGVYLLTQTYGARDQSGIALPMLIAADLMVYHGFRAHGSWKEVWRLLPPCLGGVIAGAVLLNILDNTTARPWIGGIILAMAVLLPLRARFPGMAAWLATAPVFAFAMGFTGGLATTLANAAGPIISIYLLARGLGKMDLLGTGARFFLLVNIIKVPFLAGQGLIAPSTLCINLWALPAILIGVAVGRAIVHRVPEKWFSRMIVIFSIYGGLRLLWP